MDAPYTYSGEELDVFAQATRWKAYWSGRIQPFIGRHVLEVGAGIGTNAQVFRPIPCERWVALEPDEAMCDRMREAGQQGLLPAGHEIRCGTSSSLTAHDTFDTILYIDVLEHIQDDGAELARVGRHLRPGGHLVIVSPAHAFLYSRFDRKIGHYRRYDKRSLRSVIPDGLALVTLHYLDSVGMLASLANRLLLRNDTPKASQVRLWDSFMVPASHVLDPLMRFQVGKSIICVLQKPQTPSQVP
jgi:2-polyprenyl-3-methyl-5-hydroxy-6-metoxy-1,4-benzoquinol methylase